MDLTRGRPTLSYFVRHYWTGRILLINTFIFIWMSLESHSLLMPTTEVILQFGAKDSMRLIAGEWWRYITPVFVHIGLIHFIFNSYAIYILGVQLEPVVGPRFIILMYFVAGICGNIASALYTVGISAGASSSIFGMLGCGWVLERSIGRHLEKHTGYRAPRGMYTSLLFINLILGLMIPAIDNAAHVGGLIGGVVMTYAFLFIKPNRIQKRRLGVGIILISLLAFFAGIGIHFSSSSSYASRKFEEIADQVESYPELAITFYSRAIYAEPHRLELYIKRARILLTLHERELVLEDLRSLLKNDEGAKLVFDFVDELKQNGQQTDAEFIEDNLNIRSI